MRGRGRRNSRPSDARALDVGDLEQLLDTLVESEPADPDDDDTGTRTYARGLRDGLALARRLPEKAG